MATRKRQFNFLIQRFKGFWNQYKQSKRGLLGIAIIILFGVVAILAPVIAPLDPLNPVMAGYYPGGQQPKVSEKLCVPIWYKTLLGQQQLSENLVIMDDHEFQTQETWDTKWRTTPVDLAYVITASYNATGGSNIKEAPDGGVKLIYTRDESQGAPETGKASIILSYDYEWPYEDAPLSFWWHYSVKIENRTPVEIFPIDITFRIRRGDEPEAFHVRTRQFSMTYAGGKYYSVAETTAEGHVLEDLIFTGSGDYTLEFVVSIVDNRDGDVDITAYVDNLQVINYGKAFGLLGTASVPRDSPRDLFTMLAHGTRISFMIGLLTAAFSVLIGLFVGLVAGYVRGMVDEGLMRFADFLLVLPGLPLLIVLVTVLGRSIWNIVGVLVFMGWMGFSRSVRSMVLSLRERPFIESAKASGAGTGYIIFRHILPNVFALVYISLATSVPGAIISEASLAWLGLGDINISSWGVILYDFSRTQTAVIKGLGEYWFWVIPPGLAIALMAMAFILMGFALDEILNPRLRRRR